MNRPGIPRARLRRITGLTVMSLGLLDVTLVLMRQPVIRVQPLHDLLEHSAIHGSRYVVLVAALTLLASIQGLLHGKRHAWHIAVVAAAASGAAFGLKRADLLGLSASAAVLLLLLATRRYFPARSDPVRARTGLAWLVFGELGVLAYGVAGLYLLNSDFREPNDLAESVVESVRLLFLLPLSAVEPVTRHGFWFVESVRVLAVLVLALAIWHLLRPVIQRLRASAPDREAVERLLEEYATTSLAYFHLLDDKSYFLSSDGLAFIGYRVVGGVAVALGEPVGEPNACASLAREFVEHCDLNGWACCFHQVTERGAGLLRQAGMTPLKLGEEAIVPVQQFALSGKSFRHLRNEVNRLTRDGYTCELLSPAVAESDLDQLQQVSDAWLAHSGHRERTFSLGDFSRDYMQRSEVMVVRSPEGRIEAFANIIPTYKSRSGSFDLMRRRPDGPDGSIDFLFVALIRYFKDRGHEGMNLGFAPLANIEGGGVVARSLRLVYERGNQVFNFRGLHVFKEKWHPAWEPRFLCYRSELELPQLALALARVGERDGNVGWLRGLRPRFRRAGAMGSLSRQQAVPDWG